MISTMHEYYMPITWPPKFEQAHGVENVSGIDFTLPDNILELDNGDDFCVGDYQVTTFVHGYFAKARQFVWMGLLKLRLWDSPNYL